MNESDLQAKGYVQAQDGTWFKPEYHHFGVGVCKIVEPGACASQQNNCSGSTTGPARPAKRIRQSRDKMNKLELEWFGICKAHYPEDCRILAQAIRLRLGNGIWYKPDVLVFGAAIYAYEVKGPHAFRGGFENLKVAASLYPWIKWYLVWKENGQWQEQEVLP